MEANEIKLYVVLSRDTDFLFVTKDEESAKLVKSKREIYEERCGGKPEVYIKETILK